MGSQPGLGLCNLLLVRRPAVFDCLRSFLCVQRRLDFVGVFGWSNSNFKRPLLRAPLVGGSRIIGAT